MRTKPNLKEFADGFLDGVLTPFSRSLQWIIWLAVFVLSLVVINIFLEALAPSAKAKAIGGYESTFFLAIAIEFSFFFVAYLHLSDAVDYTFYNPALEGLVDSTDENPVEPVIRLSETILGFQQGAKLRQAVAMYERENGPITTQSQVPTGQDAFKAVSTYARGSLKRTAQRAQALLASIIELSDTVTETDADELDPLQGSDDTQSHRDSTLSVPSRRNSVRSNTSTLSQGGIDAAVEFANMLGVSRSRAMTRLRGIRAIAVNVRELSALRDARAAGQAPPQQMEQMKQCCVHIVQAWADVQGLADESAATRFANTILPQYCLVHITRHTQSDMLPFRMAIRMARGGRYFVSCQIAVCCWAVQL
eukprot:m.1185055 g.1185055  ORF g.1185055 m.1185055 type:complete len:364 (-) comp24544_c1_seq17:607-1698(-)